MRRRNARWELAERCNPQQTYCKLMPRAKFHARCEISDIRRAARYATWLGVLLAGTAQLLAQPSSLPRKDFWVPDGPVNAVVETNGIVYIGGLFDYVGRVSETGMALDLVAGT